MSSILLFIYDYIPSDKVRMYVSCLLIALAEV